MYKRETDRELDREKEREREREREREEGPLSCLGCQVLAMGFSRGNIFAKAGSAAEISSSTYRNNPGRREKQYGRIP